MKPVSSQSMFKGQGANTALAGERPPPTAKPAEAFNYPHFPQTSGRVLWIPGVQTLKMGGKWGKMGKTW